MYHGVADEGVPVYDLAELIGRHLNLPVVAKPSEEAADHFGWLGHFLRVDCPASSRLTQQRLGWHPGRAALLADLKQEHYFNG